MSEWVPGDESGGLMRLPLETVVDEVTRGKKGTRLVMLRDFFLRLSAIAFALYAVADLLSAAGLRIEFLTVLEALALAIVLPLVSIGFYGIAGSREMSSRSRLMHSMLGWVLILVCLAAIVRLGQGVVLWIGEPVQRHLEAEIPGVIVQVLGGFVTRVSIDLLLILGAILALGQPATPRRPKGRSYPMIYRLKLGTSGLVYGAYGFILALISLLFFPISIRWVKITVFNMFQTPEQLQDAIQKSGMEDSYGIERDFELEKYIYGYAFTASFFRQLMWIRVISDKVILMSVRIPFPRSLRDQSKERHDKIEHILSQWEKTQYKGYSKTTVRLISNSNEDGYFEFKVYSNARHQAQAHYDQTLTVGLYSMPKQVIVQDYFYRLPYSIRNTPSGPLLEIKSRRPSADEESASLLFEYDQVMKMEKIGKEHKIRLGYLINTSYASTDEVFELLLPEWCTFIKSDPEPNWSSEHQVMFVFPKRLPNTSVGVEIMVRINEDRVSSS